MKAIQLFLFPEFEFKEKFSQLQGQLRKNADDLNKLDHQRFFANGDRFIIAHRIRKIAEQIEDIKT
jgi:hypothetical protein